MSQPETAEYIVDINENQICIHYEDQYIPPLPVNSAIMQKVDQILVADVDGIQKLSIAFASYHGLRAAVCERAFILMDILFLFTENDEIFQIYDNNDGLSLKNVNRLLCFDPIITVEELHCHRKWLGRLTLEAWYNIAKFMNKRKCDDTLTDSSTKSPRF